MTDVERLRRAFDDAAFEEGSWSHALEALAEATNSHMGQLIGVGGPSVVPFNLVTNCPPIALDDFVRIDGANPIINWRVRASVDMAPMQVAWEDHYQRARRAVVSNIYDDYSTRYDIPYGCQATLLTGGGIMVGLALLRSSSNGPTTAATRELFASILPRARIAAKTALVLEREGAKLVSGTLEAMSIAAFVCDEFGLVGAVTRPAETLLANGLALDLRQNRICARSQRDRAAISSGLRRAIGNFAGAGTSSSMVAGMPDQPFVLTFLSLPPRKWGFGFAPRVLVLIRVDDAPNVAPSLLSALFGLTKAEAAVVNAVLAGRSRNEIASDRRVSLGTVQSQLKTIFRKVGVTREVDLVAKLGWLSTSTLVH